MIQPDGKLVVAGFTRPFGPYDANPPDFALARYNANGTLDTSFGGNGKVSTAFTPGWADIAFGVALAPRGKIVAVGWGLPDGSGGPGVIDLARYNADGSLDTSFGGDGTVVSTPDVDSGAFSVVVQPDSKVVVAGFVGHSGLALVRYTASGRIDLGDSRWAGYANDLVRQPDGKFVAAGVKGVSSPPSQDFVVARFERSGRPDRSFHGGAVSTDVGAWDEGQAVALQPDGKIVVGGSTGRLSNGFIEAQDFALTRYIGEAPRCTVPNVRGKRLARGEAEDPVKALRGRTRSPRPLQASRARNRPEPETGLGQTPGLPGPARCGPALGMFDD